MIHSWLQAILVLAPTIWILSFMYRIAWNNRCCVYYLKNNNIWIDATTRTLLNFDDASITAFRLKLSDKVWQKFTGSWLHDFIIRKNARMMSHGMISFHGSKSNWKVLTMEIEIYRGESLLIFWLYYFF